MVQVSIITPLYNCSEFLCFTIESVLSQNLKGWELILVDDCSSDDSFEVAKSFASLDNRIKVFQLDENSGAAVARNTAIEAAKGRFIAFLDSDDLWSPNKLEKQLAFMQENNYPFSYAAYEKIDANGKVFEQVGVPDKVAYNDLLKVCSIGCLTAIYDTKYFGKVYMPLIRKRQDLGLWLKLLKKTEYAYGLDEPLGQYCVRSDSISANKASAAKFTWRLYREIEKLNIVEASYFFSHYAVRGLLRTKFPRIARSLGVLK